MCKEKFINRFLDLLGDHFSPAENAIAYITCGCSVLRVEYEVV